MGIALGSLIQGKEISIDQLAGKRVGVDAFNWIYQFLSIIRQRDGTPLMDSKGRITSHLSGLFYRNLNLIEAGIKLVYVFDGAPPRFKHETTAERKAIRTEAKEKWLAARAAGEFEKARKYGRAAAEMTDEILEESKMLLSAMGIPIVQAPSEGEAQLAYMAKEGALDFVASQDWDTLLFGAPRLVRNLSIYGRRKYRKQGWVMVNPELIELGAALKQLGITREELIILGILIGTDYNIGGIPDIGPVKGLKLVKEEKTLENVLKKTGWPFGVPADDIFDFFRNPPKGEYEIEFHAPDSEKIIRLLCDEHDFSRERIETALARIGGQTRKSVKKKDKGEPSQLSAFLKK